MLKFNHSRGGFFAHEADGLLVTQPIRSLHGVIHMPSPVIFPHIGERRAHAALRGYRMRARREDLGDTGGTQSRFCETQTGT